MAQRLNVELVANILDLVEVREATSSFLIFSVTTCSTHQFKYHLLLVQMFQFVSWQSLGSVNTTRCAILVLYRPGRWFILCVDAEEGWRAINGVNNRFQQPTTLKFMCWDFPIWWMSWRIDGSSRWWMNEKESNFNLYAHRSITNSFTWQGWLRPIHCVKNIVADSREWAMRRASSCRCQRWQMELHEIQAMSRQHFWLPFAWSNSERTLDSRRATTPCEHIQHHSGWYGDLSWVGVATDCFRAPNLCPPQRAFCFGAPLYSVDAVLEERRLHVNSKLFSTIRHCGAASRLNKQISCILLSSSNYLIFCFSWNDKVCWSDTCFGPLGGHFTI